MSDLQDVVDEVSLRLGARVTLEDRAFRLVAFAAQVDQADAVRLETILRRGVSAQTRAWFESFGIARARHPVRVPGDPERALSPRVCIPARSRGVVQGYLWAIEAGEPIADEALADVMPLAAQAGDLLARHQARRRETARLVHELLQAPLGAAEVAAAVLARASGLPGRVLVAVIGRSAGEPGALVSRAGLESSGLAPRPGVLADDDHGVLVVLPCEDGAEGRVHQAMANLVAELEEQVRSREGGSRRAGVIAGVGDPVALADLRRSWVQARQALGTVALLPGHDRLGVWSELGVMRVLGGSAGHEVVDAVRTPAVAALLAHEELAHTALAYLDAGGSVARTAEILGLHRQSLYYRLGRIEAVTGLDLRDGRARLEVHLGLVTLSAVNQVMQSRHR